MKIVFFGTSHFAEHILSFLVQNSYDIIAVVTKPDKPQGRSQKILPSSVKSFLQKSALNIPLFQPEVASSEIFAQQLKDLSPDLFIVVAYGEILKKAILQIPKIMPINVHASLLPKYRGAAPIQRAIMAGEEATGITIIEMSTKMDAGDMLEKLSLPIKENEAFIEVEKNLCQLACVALQNVLKKIQAHHLIKIPQNQEEVTLAPKITLEDRMIDWRKSALHIHNQIRALSPSPGAFCYIEMDGVIKNLGIKKSKIIATEESHPGHTKFFSKKEWEVGCGQDAIALLEVQLEGKKILSIQQFLQGCAHPPKISIKT